MYTIQFNLEDPMYDKVMLFLKHIPISNLEVQKIEKNEIEKKDNIVSFFQNSPLVGSISIERENK